MNITKVLRTTFKEQLWCLLLNQVLVSERRKLVERLPLNQLACFMYQYKSLQAGQLPREHFPFLQSLLSFTITKYLKQEVDG